MVLPVGASCTRPKFLRSWDNFLVPLPFSRCVVVFGEPLRREPGEPDEAFLARLDRGDRRRDGRGGPDLRRDRSSPRTRERSKGEADDA